MLATNNIATTIGLDDYGSGNLLHSNAYESDSRVFPIVEEGDAAVHLDFTGGVTEPPPPHHPYSSARWMNVEFLSPTFFDHHIISEQDSFNST